MHFDYVQPISPQNLDALSQDEAHKAGLITFAGDAHICAQCGEGYIVGHKGTDRSNLFCSLRCKGIATGLREVNEPDSPALLARTI